MEGTDVQSDTLGTAHLRVRRGPDGHLHVDRSSRGRGDPWRGDVDGHPGLPGDVEVDAGRIDSHPIPGDAEQPHVDPLDNGSLVEDLDGQSDLLAWLDGDLRPVDVAPQAVLPVGRGLGSRLIWGRLLQGRTVMGV